MKTCGIYKILCVESQRFYIGSSVQIEKRWVQHRRALRVKKHRNPRMQAAWDKYGDASFLFMIVEECSEEFLKDREQYWIDHTAATTSGFNIERYARVITATHREKLSETKGRTISIAHKAAMSRGRLGMKFSESHCANISKAKMGKKIKKRSDESKARSSIAIAKWHEENGHRVETKAAISTGVRAYLHSNPRNKWGVTGLTYIPNKNKSKPWLARLWANGKVQFSGSFAKKDDAAMAIHAFISGDAQ